MADPVRRGDPATAVAARHRIAPIELFGNRRAPQNRPPSISGHPVKSEIFADRDSILAQNRAVPPVETISTPATRVAAQNQQAPLVIITPQPRYRQARIPPEDKSSKTAIVSAMPGIEKRELGVSHISKYKCVGITAILILTGYATYG